ncbi:protein kinase [Nocardiopsis sp. CNR-923]|uniref:protein kinase n=1 Tax=Nocardiopsis sp. CNR-923 TaxID=1904965 RepID=UPI00117CB68C|nr:protein kinase [Nocardiopsis sp. CNR-923]
MVGFDAIDARATDFTPGSEDLPVVIDTVNRACGVSLPAMLAKEWEETRWDRFATDEERSLLKGDTLIHTDVHGRNLLIDTGGRGWLVDWEWPTAGAAVIVSGCLAVQLVSAGHSPASAQEWVARTLSWQEATPEACAGFARVNARMSRWFAEMRGENWLKAMAEAADRWCEHVTGR